MLLQTAIRIYKGLSFTINGSCYKSHFHIPVTEEIEQNPDFNPVNGYYSYRLSVGLSYSFGSIYQNIVNPRFRVH